MKVALQISGHLRQINETWPLFKKNIFEANPECEFDIFIHTWSNTDNLKEGLELFKPILHIIEDPKPEMINRISMFYSMWKVNELRRSHTSKYDLVIRYRTDCLIQEPILFNTSISKLYIPTNKTYLTADGPVEEESYCDWFLYGSPDTMNIVSDTYLFWDKYINDNGFGFGDTSFIPMSESMLYIQVNRHQGLFSIERPCMEFKIIR